MKLACARITVAAIALALCLPAMAALDYRHPRPSGYGNDPSIVESKIDFTSIDEQAGVVFDVTATFPKRDGDGIQIERVEVNGQPQESYLVRNHGVINGHRQVMGDTDFSISTYVNWQPATEYRVQIAGRTGAGEALVLETVATAPAELPSVGKLNFGRPDARIPYHHAKMTIPKETVEPGKVLWVEIDGKRTLDARYFNVGMQNPAKAESSAGPVGESNQGVIDGSRDFQIVAPVHWTSGSSHTMRVAVGKDVSETVAEAVNEAVNELKTKAGGAATEIPELGAIVAGVTQALSGEATKVEGEVGAVLEQVIAALPEELRSAVGDEKIYEASGTGSGEGGYWDTAWKQSISITLKETAGLARMGEPVDLELGLLADDVTDAAREIRVVTYSPDNPRADEKGYVVAPVQVYSAHEWRDEALLTKPEVDEHGAEIHRYMPTTTVELVFAADVAPYEERVYQVLYGNPNAEAQQFESSLKVSKGDGLSGHVANEFYEFGLASNSGVVETVKILGEGEPVLLEHKLETNGAVHWSPDFYSPPKPWVHISDWEKPKYGEATGPLMHRSWAEALLPMINEAEASINYTFYANQPYVLMTSYMRVLKESFVQAMRNGEIVFNHAVLNEFIWKDHMGKVHSMMIEGSKEHPTHAIEIPPDVPWLAFINRDRKVGFAGINLDFVVGNVHGEPESAAQPYYYVQNGPWIYWSRPIVYPFGGMNFTRMMRVREGSFYYEKIGWLPFRLAGGADPFAPVDETAEKLMNPLLVHEWSNTDERTPDHWILPILTMPFDEGVAGAKGSEKQKVGE